MHSNAFGAVTSMSCKQPSMYTRQQLLSVHLSQDLPEEVKSVEAVVQAQQPASRIEYRPLAIRSMTVGRDSQQSEGE